MTIAALMFFVVFFGTIFSKRKLEPQLDLPVSEILHDEKRIPLFDTFKPWLITMAVIIVIAYVPAFIDANNNPGAGAPQFTPDNPVPVESSSAVDETKNASSTFVLKK